MGDFHWMRSTMACGYEITPVSLGRFALEIRKHFFGRFTAIKYTLKKSERTGACGNRRRAAKGKLMPASRVRRRLRQIGQQSLTGLRRKPVGNPDQIDALPACRVNHVGNGYRRAEKQRAPSGCFSQPQKIADACHMHALAQRSGQNSFHADIVTQSIFEARPRPQI